MLMEDNGKMTTSWPTAAEWEAEYDREKYKRRYRSTLRSTIFTLIIVAAISVLIATLWLPILQIYGSSMTPTLYDGNIVVTVKSNDYEQGDIIAFYYNNKILVKRVIGTPSDWIDMSEDGTVIYNYNALNEPYVQEKAIGECNITFPYQVPEERFFVMGDHRSVSIDSRHSSIGCVAEEQIVGKIVFRIWPLSSIGGVE